MVSRISSINGSNVSKSKSCFFIYSNLIQHLSLWHNARKNKFMDSATRKCLVHEGYSPRTHRAPKQSTSLDSTSWWEEFYAYVPVGGVDASTELINTTCLVRVQSCVGLFGVWHGQGFWISRWDIDSTWIFDGIISETQRKWCKHVNVFKHDETILRALFNSHKGCTLHHRNAIVSWWC